MAKLTTAFVAKAKPGRHYDDELHGYGLYVGPTGSSYFVEYRPGRGREHRVRRFTFGRHGGVSLEGTPWTAFTARREAQRLLGRVKNGSDPLAEREARERKAEVDASRTVKAVFKTWMDMDQSDNRTEGQVRKSMERNVLPYIGERPIDAVSKRDIIEIIDRVHGRAPSWANKVLAHIKRLFRWAAGRDIVSFDPARDIEKPTRDVPRDRTLDDAELIAVWHAAGRIGGAYGNLIRMLVLTGARLDEIREATASELQYEGEHPCAIALPASRSKVKAARRIWLNDQAREIIAARPRFKSGRLFTTDGERPVSAGSHAKGRLDAELAGAVASWRQHDLRRTVATNMQRLGVRLEVTEAVLGHVSGSRAGIVGVYQRHSFDAEARAALELWGRYLQRLLDGEPAQVIALRRSAQ